MSAFLIRSPALSASAGKIATPMLALIRTLWPPIAKGARKRRDDPLGEQAGMAGLAAACLDDGELVAAEPRHQLVAARPPRAAAAPTSTSSSSPAGWP